jgi:hypothetical protein
MQMLVKFLLPNQGGDVVNEEYNKHDALPISDTIILTVERITKHKSKPNAQCTQYPSGRVFYHSNYVEPLSRT